MNVDERIKKALEPVVAVVEPNSYDGKELEYIVFNYTELPTAYGDDSPKAIRYMIQIHWFLPADPSPYPKKRKIKGALTGAGFLYPTVTNASDGDGQHYIFETEWLDGIL